MTELAKLLSSPASLESTASLDAWSLARKRADDYLKFNRLPQPEREHLLARITYKLAQTNCFDEQELIRLFIGLAQEELALLQPPSTDGACCQCRKPVSNAVDTTAYEMKPEARTQTGPRVQRSSIRVAPLKAITLLPSRTRARSRQF